MRLPARLASALRFALALFVSAAALYPAAAQEAEEAPPENWYQIDVIVFEPVPADLAGEDWPQVMPALPSDITSVSMGDKIRPMNLSQLEQLYGAVAPDEALFDEALLDEALELDGAPQLNKELRLDELQPNKEAQLDKELRLGEQLRPDEQLQSDKALRPDEESQINEASQLNKELRPGEQLQPDEQLQSDEAPRLDKQSQPDGLPQSAFDPGEFVGPPPPDNQLQPAPFDPSEFVGPPPPNNQPASFDPDEFVGPPAPDNRLQPAPFDPGEFVGPPPPPPSNQPQPSGAGEFVGPPVPDWYDKLALLDELFLKAAEAPANLAFEPRQGVNSMRNIARNLSRDPGFNLLTHQAWLQPLTQEPTPVLIQAGERQGDLFAVEGSVALSVARYLHLSAHLWFTQFEPSNPNAKLRPNQVETSLDEETLNANQDLVDIETRRGQMVPAQRHEMQQSRRIRLNESHYIDHPLFGVIVRITRYTF